MGLRKFKLSHGMNSDFITENTKKEEEETG
jgi:hypothetical protein